MIIEEFDNIIKNIVTESTDIKQNKMAVVRRNFIIDALYTKP